MAGRSSGHGLVPHREELAGNHTAIAARGDTLGLFAFSRLSPEGKGETLAVFNTGTTPIETQVEVGNGALDWSPAHGTCEAKATAPAATRSRSRRWITWCAGRGEGVARRLGGWFAPQ